MPFPPIAIFPLAFLNNMFGVDGLVVLIIGLLIFGRRLPNVGSNLWRTITEARRDTDPVTFLMVFCLTIVLLLLFTYFVSHHW